MIGCVPTLARWTPGGWVGGYNARGTGARSRPQRAENAAQWGCVPPWCAV